MTSTTPEAIPPTNWAGNYVYRAREIVRPATLGELSEILAAAPRVRVLGSRHSFTGIADSDLLVSLSGVADHVAVDPETSRVTVGGAVRYGELAVALNEAGLALPNLASLPHISVAGAVATGTHGSGDRNTTLAGSVVGLTLVTSAGETARLTPDHADFAGAVVGLGATGAVLELELQAELGYEVSQRVYAGMSWASLLENFDAVTGAGYSVSVFSRFGAATEHVWVKNRVVPDPLPPPEELFGAPAARTAVHAIAGLDPVNCTPQLGVPGPWSERLSHFRMGFTPSSGAEIQSEYILPRARGVEAIEAVLRLGRRLDGLIQVSEIRTIASDELWMSPAQGRASVAIHFTWIPDQPAVEAALVEVEAALLPLGARPHWGKLFLAQADALTPVYEHHGDFVALTERLDPRGAFRNEWLERHVLGA